MTDSGNTEYVDEDFMGAVEEILAAGRLITSRRVADRVGCSRELARQWLKDQSQQGRLDAERARGVVYRSATHELEDVKDFRVVSAQSPEGGGDVASPQDEPRGPIAPPQDDGERVMFFPSRREIGVDDPDEWTQTTLAQTAHLVDSTGDSYLYKIDEADVWTAPYDDFEELRDDLVAVVGEDDWDGGFESRIRDDWERAHQFRLYTHGDEYTVLEAADEVVFENVAKRKLQHNDHYTQYVGDKGMRLKRGVAADVKEVLYDEGYPVVDERRLEAGASLDVELASDLELRDYQQDWVDHFEARGSGVYVGPSGSGKTIAAIATMAAVGGETLIIVPNRELCQQWADELAEKTTLSDRQVGQYHGGQKQIRPVTIATYDTAAMSRHRKLFNERDWGLVIADECHHAVANTWKRFREIQSVARLGLSATPVRESGDAKEIFTLIGPPIGTDWGTLFADDWVAEPDVELVMVPWATEQARDRYQRADGQTRMIQAASNPAKEGVIRTLLRQHDDAKTLIFVDWISQGKQFAEALDKPFLHGKTDHATRETHYQQFRDGELEALILSRIGDEGIDLPDAEVAILASTMGSSRSQTGQRAGRAMRPFGEAQVYVLLTKGTGEEDWGRESTQYLAEKGINVTKTGWEGDA